VSLWAADRVATAGDAYIARDDAAQTWTVANLAISATFQIDRGGESRLLHLTNVVTGHAWETASASDTVTLIAGHQGRLGASNAGYQLVDVSGTSTDRSVHLTLAFDHRDTHLRVTRHYVVYAGVPAIETWTRFETQAGGDVEVSDLNVWDFTFAGQQIEWLNGLLGDNADAPRDDAFSLHQMTLAAGDRLDLGSETRSSDRVVPYFKILDRGEAIVGGLLWSGAWHLGLEGRSVGTALSFGLAPMTTLVNSSRAVETPHGFLAVAGNADESSRAIRAYVQNGLRGGRGFDPLVTYNTWFAYGTRIDEASMMDEMQRTSELGTELFVLDAGWYAGAGREGPWDFADGLGRWQSDPARFPSTLHAFTDFAHSLNMKFGLWIEPERLALDTLNGGASADESWLATVGGRYDPNATGHGVAAQLCLASDAARRWILGEIVRLVDEVQPDYLKWDNNFWINCDRPGHGHGASDGNFAHVTGLYEVLAALRARYPGLVIENVSGGGNRLDYGMLRYTDVAWMDDRTAPSIHVRHNFEGLSAAFPPSYLLSFLIQHDTESLYDGPDLPLYIRSRMPGVLGLTFRTVDLRPSAAGDITSHISLYKELRDTIKEGSAILLTRQASVDDPLAWGAVQEIDAAGHTLIFAVQNDPAVEHIILKPRRLSPNAMYDVRSVDVGPIGSASGADLMANGIDVVTAPKSAAHVLVISEQPK
jgi:alpha-galactosidase